MYSPFKFRPKLFDCLQGYSLKTFGADLSAGVTVGVIALPMAMAFAIGSNVSPAAGIITGVIAGFLTSLLGGSHVAIGGPTGAFVAIVAGIVATYGFSGLLICTMMAGAMLFLMGLIRLGLLIRYMPAPLVKGFTTGIALIILCGQLKDFLGINAELANTSNILSTINSLAPHLGAVHLPTLLLSAACLAALFLWPKKLNRFVPASIAVMLLATAASAIGFTALGISVETIGSRFGGIPRTLSFPQLPSFDLETFQSLLAPAMTIALLGAIESLLCATAADGMIEDQHNPDQELMAQGVANMITPLFGGIPSTGAIARTAANIRSGGKTPVAGMIHALVLLLIMLLAAPLAKYIPLSVLSAILIMVAVNMGDWREFIQLRRYPRSDATVFLVTFLLTIIFGLTQAVSVGMFAACILFIRRMSEQSRVGIKLMNHHTMTNSGREAADGAEEEEEKAARELRDDVLLVNITGAMFFGASQKLRRILRYIKPDHKVIILRMSRVISLDATALLTLEDIITKARKRNIQVVIYGLHHQPLASMRRSGLLKDIPRENLTRSLDGAMRRAALLIDEEGFPR